MRWLIKAAVQGALSQLPNPQRYNRPLKALTGSLRVTDDDFIEKYEQGLRHAEHHRTLGSGRDDFVALELGTGWLPIVPLALRLNGAAQVYSVDVQSLLTHDQLLRTLEHCLGLLDAGRLTASKPGLVDTLRSVTTRKPDVDPCATLAELGIDSLLQDARQLSLPDDSVDLIVSNNTLEHIPRPVIAELFAEFRRVTKRDGLMSHHIDLSDHYAVFDRSIGVHNFLQFSERSWALFNNRLQYQNRLRIGDFRDLHAETGWEIAEEDDQSDLGALARIRVHPCFDRYSRADLAVYSTWLAARSADRPRL